ncbi:MAG: Gldg family protein, partial [Bacteroidota bacterium]
MKQLVKKIFASKYWWLLLLLIVFGVNFIAFVFLPLTRLDLTKEKRYTLSKATKELLLGLDDEVSIDVFLKGEFPAGFKKLANSTADFLQLLKDQNGSKIHYNFVSPQDEMPGSKTLYGDSLVSLGAVPINLTVQKKAGESSNIIFPVAILHYKDKQSLVNLYPGASGRISQEEINSAEALMEYQFDNALFKLAEVRRPGIV